MNITSIEITPIRGLLEFDGKSISFGDMECFFSKYGPCDVKLQGDYCFVVYEDWRDSKDFIQSHCIEKVKLDKEFCNNTLNINIKHSIEYEKTLVEVDAIDQSEESEIECEN